MRYEEVDFDISPEVIDLQLSGAYYAIGELSNRESDYEFEKEKAKIIKEILTELTPEIIENDIILRGFRQLHNAVGKSSNKIISSPENLMIYLLQNGDIPKINLLVDIYNLVSIKTRLALGAHDLDKVSGNIHLKLTDGSESFWPLGYKKTKPVGPGEYSYVDDKNDILCWLEVRQVEKTKITLDTTQCFYIIQGNKETDANNIKRACDDLLRLTKKYCGGKERLLYAPWV